MPPPATVHDEHQYPNDRAATKAAGGRKRGAGRKPAAKTAVARRGEDFAGLVKAIRDVNAECTAQASRAVNVSLTLRNWLIGAHIHHYELHGTDRAQYGERLLAALAERLAAARVSNTDKRQLYRYLRLFRLYPEIVGTLSPQFAALTPTDGEEDAATLVRAAGDTPPALDDLASRLSYSHLEAILALDDPLARRFYEAEAVRGGWSVRELKRQIGSMYLQRMALSVDKDALAAQTRAAAARRRRLDTREFVRDPYVFEFLGLDPQHVMGESALEDALLDKLQALLLELGYGFCFEARQKRLLIGDTHCFVDLVFYHRVLKCHVLVELKTERFTHEHLGQLNTYVSYYRATQMTDGDQPPVGILLCTEKDQALVEYALAGMNNALFVSRYQTGLPGPEQLSALVRRAVDEVGRATA